MKLTELDPQFVLFMDAGRYIEVEEMEASNGVRFLCPKCYQKNGGPIGTHMVLCWFRDRDVPDDEPPVPGRWTATGTDLADLTLRASVHLPGDDCGWHGFVTNGEVSII